MKISDGFMLIDKPAGVTSHDVVDWVRKKTGERKVGHAGTLDPFATGLLIIGVGREATKRLDEFKALPKTYEVIAKLGATSSTGDPTGVISTATSRTSGVKKSHTHQKTKRVRSLDYASAPLEMTKKDVEKILKKFIGEQEQIPPMYSAKKIKGKKLYELARKGKTIKRKPQKITIYKIEILRYNYPELKLRVQCSAGTYIRTLVEDVGERLDTGAYVRELRRTHIGNYKMKDAEKISNF